MKRITAISLALIIWITHIGLSINTHYCGGRAVKASFSIGRQDADCGMANAEKSCEGAMSDSRQVSSGSCCANHHQLIQSEETATLPSYSTNVNPVFLIAFVHAFIQPLAIVFADRSVAQSKSPPPHLSERDIQALFQTFLI